MGAQGKASPMAESIQVSLLLFLPLICISVLYVVLQYGGSTERVALDAIHTQVHSQMKYGSRAILLINVSTVRLAKFLSSLSRSHFENQVAHNLFLLYSIVPYLSQVSYFGDDGLFSTYHIEGNRTLTLFSNTSISPSNTDLNQTVSGYHWYHQEVDETTGIPHGEAVEREPIAYWASSWFRRVLHSDVDHVSWALEWSNQEPLFTCIVPVRGLTPGDQRGVVALGVPVKILLGFVSSMRLRGVDMFLATKNEKLIADYQFYNVVPNRRALLMQQAANSQSIVASTKIQTLMHMKNGDSSIKNEMYSVLDVNIEGTRDTLHPVHFKFFGLPLVSALAFPHNNATYFVPKENDLEWILPVPISITIIFMTCFYVFLAYRAARIMVLLRASLIKQIEATRQAERKSMNKTIAFASTSHDVRTILAAIFGLLDHCIANVTHQPELYSCLVEIKSFSSNLLGILNSVLDTSKIEAGKMQLEEVEFDLAQVLEDVVDMFCVSASEKGVEVVLDPCDGSIQKYFAVKGDCKRFQQILCNLLSNAVKFTSEGHIVVRAWAKKISSQNFMMSLRDNGQALHLWHYLSPWYCCNNDKTVDVKSLQDSNGQDLIEVMVEVDDTGKGIPKDKHESVFENFIQVKERDAENYGGIGLGLGIVQSLVRLMGGEINIVDKEPSERGTCFKFTIIIKATENFVDLKYDKADKFFGVNVIDLPRQPSTLSVEGHPSLLSSQLPTNVSELALGGSFDIEGTFVILLLKGEARKRILKKWMEQQGLQVYALDHLEKLHSLHEIIEPKVCQITATCSETISDDSSRIVFGGSSFKTKEQEVDVSTSHMIDDCLSSSIMGKGNRQRMSFRSKFANPLFIIEMAYGPVLELCKALSYFIDHVQASSKCKVVWIAGANTLTADIESVENSGLPCDLILYKPLHGSRLYAAVSLVCDFGKRSKGCEATMLNKFQDPQLATRLHTSDTRLHIESGSSNTYQWVPSSDKPLKGLKILVVDDNIILLHLMTATLARLGATVESSNNGEDAFVLVRASLQGLSDNGIKKCMHENKLEVPEKEIYDIIFMDCEMPVMNGCEATMKIRDEEKYYGDVHIPIIALTAHATTEATTKSLQSGMDFHLVKPVTEGQVLNAIKKVLNV